MHALPPLNALRAFEAAARTGSFVQAAAELGVTSAAVSQQVKALEGFLGRKLFLRRGNRLSLTDAGMFVYPRLGEAFAGIAEVAASVREARVRRGLVVSVLPSLLEGWFLPRLAAWRASGQANGIVVRIDEDPVDFAAAGIDLRLTYGNLHYGEFRTVELYRDRVVPVVAPALLQSVGSLAALPDAQFLHLDWGPSYASHPTWAAWFAQAGMRRWVDPDRGVHVSWSIHAVRAAAEGMGAALVPMALAARELREGRLVVIDGPSMPLDRPYIAAYPNALARRTDLRALVRFLEGAPLPPEEGADSQ